MPPEANPANMPLVSQFFLLTLLVVFGFYLVFEVVRWTAGNRASLTLGQYRRRLWGGGLLELDILLWLLFQPVMTSRPAREQLLYLLLCMLLVIVPMLLAVREAAFVSRQFLRWRQEMVHNYDQASRPAANPSDAPDL
jgi:hypothetical protein